MAGGVSRQVSGISDGGGGGNGGGDGGAHRAMLARLASYAMVPVLQLSLTVVATESRWRMIQLLTRLLAALDEGGQPIAGHLDALQQWLPTAWTACHGEQLLMEAVLDSASAMLAAARPAPLPLLLASLQLVDAATQPDGAGGLLHAAGGLMEVALRLWKSALASLHPALRAEPALAAGFGALAARLPLVLELGDELLRPSMFVLDWCALQDAQLLACGGRFAAAHGGMLASLLEGALSRNPERRGALAAIYP